MLFFLQAIVYGFAAGLAIAACAGAWELWKVLSEFVREVAADVRSSSRREPNVPFADLDVADRLDGAGDLQPVVDPSAWQSTLYLDDPRRHVGQE